MLNIEHFFELLKESNTILIGYKYDFQSESLKNELISKIPTLKVNDISSFSDIRNFKIDKILSNEGYNFEYLIIDLDELYSKPIYNTNTNKITEYHKISRQIEKLTMSFRNQNMYKVIMISSFYNSNNREFTSIPSIKGGNTSMYISDLYFTIESNQIKIRKNRYGVNNESISVDGLKNYNYICNYEYSK